MASKNTEVVPTDDPGFAGELARQGDIAITDPEAISRAIVESIGQAQTVEELLSPTSIARTEDYLDLPLQIQGQRWMKSAFAEGLGTFCVVDAVRLDTGEAVTFSCGAANVMAKLYKAQVEGWELPPVKLYKSATPTANGYHVFDLIAANN